MSTAPESARPVGTLQLLALGLNGIVGVGIFFAPATVAATAPGLGAVAVFALVGVALLPAALTFATLGRRFDVDGGPVVFARAAFGERVAFLVGWVASLSGVAMRVEVEELGACKRRLQVEEAPEVVRAAWELAMSSVQREATLPGFRKGKVPGA